MSRPLSPHRLTEGATREGHTRACNFEGPPARTCVGDIKDIRQVTGGFWRNFDDGPAGKVRVGAQYSYTVKHTFVGIGGAPRAVESTFFPSLRLLSLQLTSRSCEEGIE